MDGYQEATARHLDFESGVPFDPAATAKRPRPAPLCVVCGQHPARLTVAQHRAQRPAKLCLRCHHAVMRQRKMIRVLPATLEKSASASIGRTERRAYHKSGDPGLIVPRGASMSPEARGAELNHRRRRAQVAARQALDVDDCSD